MTEATHKQIRRLAKRHNLIAHCLRGYPEGAWVFEERSSRAIMRNQLLTDQEALDWLNENDGNFWNDEMLANWAKADSVGLHARLAANPVDWSHIRQKANQRGSKEKDD